jgi:formylglycine-generating enzyme required for sulfatase activity
MSSTEITNVQYQEFLNDLKRRGELEKLQIAQIDSACWTRGKMYGEPMAKYYHNHPAYDGYPVVGISKEGAELFCAWLSEKYAALSNGELKLSFRLPTQEEWMRAARGEKHYQTYAWETPFLRNKDGLMCANFLAVGAENVRRNAETGVLEITTDDLTINHLDGAFDIVAPAKSYAANAQGFYNLNGNVAELLSDGSWAAGGGWTSPGFDIRNESVMQVKGPRPDVGFRVVATFLN